MTLLDRSLVVLVQNHHLDPNERNNEEMGPRSLGKRIGPCPGGALFVALGSASKFGQGKALSRKLCHHVVGCSMLSVFHWVVLTQGFDVSIPYNFGDARDTPELERVNVCMAFLLSCAR